MCEGDIKILLGTTSHYKSINLISKMNLLSLTNFIDITLIKNNVNLSNFYGYFIFIIELNRLQILVKRCPHNITKKFKLKQYYKLWI